MNSVIAIVGRPNVGKSTFFNRLTKTQDALVVDRPGVTRDRQYGIAHHQDRRFLIVDTGGLGEDEHDSQSVADLMEAQSMQAAEEADLLLWLVDGRDGVTATDEKLAGILRKLDKPVYLLINKLEGMDTDVPVSEFYQLGFEQLWPVSAKHGEGISRLLDKIIESFPDEVENREINNETITLSVLGRPNVGKSTLVNRMLGEDRVLTFDQPGTTRDSIRIPFEKEGQQYTIIDTAGVRRRSRIDDMVEKFSAIKSFRTIDQANIILFIIDGQEGITDQDNSLLGIAEDSGKALIIAINKWDSLEPTQKNLIRSQLDRKCRFVDYARIHFISALHGSGVGDLFKTIKQINRSLLKKYSSSDITNMLYQCTETNPPPMVRGRRIKLRYAHLGGHNPIRIIIHGNQTEHMPNNYLRYMSRSFRQQMKLVGTPVLIQFKRGDNPYKDKKNKLNKRQIEKRRRLMRHVKKR